MEMREVTISNGLMDALVFKFFKVPLMNDKRREMNFIKACKIELGKIHSWSPEARDVPMFEVYLKFNLPIENDEAVKYFNLFDRAIESKSPDLPFYSLMSPNCQTGLKVYLTKFTASSEVDGIGDADIECASHFYKVVDGKYLFSD